MVSYFFLFRKEKIMIKFENYEVLGWEHAIRGMRNPKNSWEKSDSKICLGHNHDTCDFWTLDRSICNLNHLEGELVIGPNDHDLMMRLAKGGPVHAKYRRMITVYVDITAPLYWWKEFDTYKVGTVANSCSTMHKIHAKKFTLEDFSCEHLMNFDNSNYWEENDDNSCFIDKRNREGVVLPLDLMTDYIIPLLNVAREKFIETKDKKYWWQMIQLLPSSYNQKRTVMLNYEVLANIYKSRKNHKLDEWRDFCVWIEGLPYSELIIGENDEEK
jgi:hypothetical protein